MTGVQTCALPICLTYMIRFQNTGNDTAFLVVIRDTLNNAFDFSTLEYVSSSHACKINVTHDGAAEFRFENILLPYKAEDESNSNGFVKFRIHVKQGTTDYTVINNKAFIQFDFNYSIETNSTQNTMVYTIPIGIETPPYEWNCKLFPNPMSESATLLFDNKSHDPVLLIIYDISGKKISEMSTYSNSININKKQMSNGIYLWKLINERSLKSMHGKIVVN